MSRVMVHEPADDLRQKIIMARNSIINREKREIKCPYCNHVVIRVYNDSTGFIECKCKKCKTDVLVDLVSMRKMRYKI